MQAGINAIIKRVVAACHNPWWEAFCQNPSIISRIMRYNPFFNDDQPNRLTWPPTWRHRSTPLKAKKVSKAAFYRVIRLKVVKSKLFWLWMWAFLTLCCKDQNWFEDWQFYMVNFHFTKKLKKMKSFCKSLIFLLTQGKSWTWDL